jgi:hypothetical protein
VHRSVTPVRERLRVHLDLVVDSPAEQSSEVDRLVELGAARVADVPRAAVSRSGQMPCWAVMRPSFSAWTRAS